MFKPPRPERANWSGSIRFTPAGELTPAGEQPIIDLINQARRAGRTVRPTGAGHSSSPIFATNEFLVDMMSFQGLVSADAGACEAVIRSGTRLEDAGKALHAAGLGFHNLGDINVQTIGGAIGTGTHGSGATLGNLSTMLIGGRLIDGCGRIHDFSIDDQPELTRALRVSLGVLGVLTDLRIRALPAYRLHRQEWCGQTDDCLAHLDTLIATNRNFDFYWYPRSDEVKLRTLNVPGEESRPPPCARLVEDRTDWSHQIISKERELRFEEMEYALPADAGYACFQEIRQRIKERHRRIVGWRVLYRTVAPDDAMLSPAYGRPTVTISLHQNATLPYQAFFDDLEPVFRSYGGRPHWGKKHCLTGADLRPLYPEWDRFLDIRKTLDPDGVFLTGPLRRLLGID